MASLEDLTVDQLLARAKELEASAALTNDLLRNKETRSMVQHAIKKIRPDLVIPEIDSQVAIDAKFAEMKKDSDDLRRQILERDTRERLERERTAARDKYGLSDADMLKVAELMVDKDNPIPTYDAAARVHKASTTPSTPTPANFQPPTYTMPEKEVWGTGIGNPAKLNKIAMDQAFAAFNEIKSGKVAH